MDETKSFNLHLYEDIKGILCLYEASFLSIEGENILETTKSFTMEYLEKYIRTSKNVDEAAIIKHALELPLHWRISRLETRWFIDIYERKVDINPILLEFAKLDFNTVQSIHQQDLKYASNWWKSIGLGEKLRFARDRMMESFLWTVGIGFEPQLSYYRRMSTKDNALITIIDDVYDVYGTFDELQLFTNAVERWDVGAVDQLMSFHTLRKQYEWVDLCKSYMLEAKWYYTNYKPTLEEYLDNAWISISGPVIRDELERGDVPKSIQCYMNDTGALESNAREHIKHLIDETWKKLNKVEVFMEGAKNLARMVQCMYQHGDGHGIGHQETKNRVMSLLIQPISIHPLSE
ncbi:unnamed protein product [Citrullus colocynthis]|uniref:Uncharacterized protein n=1 Tax=Citrullus colocynthis TaxID=252529 RepID=A0ABP0Y9T9_9ROSI